MNGNVRLTILIFLGVLLVLTSISLLFYSSTNQRTSFNPRAASDEIEMTDEKFGLTVKVQKTPTVRVYNILVSWDKIPNPPPGSTLNLTLRKSKGSSGIISQIPSDQLNFTITNAQFSSVKLEDGEYFVQLRYQPSNGVAKFQKSFFSTNSEQNGKLSQKDRFGMGWGYPTMKFFKNFDWQGFKAGWYTDWGYKNIPENVSENLDSQYGIARLALIGGYGGDEFSPKNCSDLQDHIRNNKPAFPASTMWTVGNELGWDQPGMTAQKYVDNFVNWKKCVAEVSSELGFDWQVGSGATVSPWSKHPRTPPPANPGCVTNPDETGVNSGANYIRKYVGGIRSKYGEAFLPDFFVMHGYYDCVPENIPENQNVTDQATRQLNRFKKSITKTREVLEELGLRNKSLVIKEYFTSSAGYPGGDKAFMNDSVAFLMKAVDSKIGDPKDGNKLVQRFAWFVLTNGPDKKWNPLAYNNWDGDGSITGELTNLGQNFKKLSTYKW